MSLELLVLNTVSWLGAVVLWVAFADRRASNPGLIYLAYHFLSFVVRPWLLVDPTTAVPMVIGDVAEYVDQHAFALLVANIGLYSFIVGGVLGDRVRLATTPPQSHPTVPYAVVRVVGWAIIVGALVSQVAFNPSPIGDASHAGVTTEYSGMGSTYVAVNTTIPGFVTSFTYLLVGAMMVFVSYTGLKWWHVGVLALYFALRLYSGWGRFTVLLGVGAIVLSVMSVQNRRWPTRRELVAVTGATGIFISGKVVGQLLFERRWEDAAQQVGAGFSAILRTGDFIINYDFLVGTVFAVPQYLDHTLARFYVVPFWYWIPRTLWADKPVFWYPGAYIDQAMDFVGFTVNLVGESYISAGLLGVVLVPALLGHWLARVHRRGWAAPPSSGRRILTLAVVTVLPQLYRDGFSGLWLFFLFYGSPYCIMWLAARILRSVGALEDKMEQGKVAAALPAER
jgi:hypothetical protein